MNEKLEAIRRAAQAEIERSPTVRPWWVDALVLVGLNLASGALAIVLLTVTIDGIAMMQWAGALTLAGVAVFGAVAAVRPGWEHVRQMMLVVSAVAIVLVLVGSTGFDPGHSFLGGRGCGLWECMMSLVPVAASTFVLSRFALDATRTVLGGLAAGAGGLAALHLHCPNGTLGHVVVFHLVPWLVVSALGLGLRKLVRSSSYAP